MIQLPSLDLRLSWNWLLALGMGFGLLALVSEVSSALGAQRVRPAGGQARASAEATDRFASVPPAGGSLRSETRSTLRSGKCRHAFFVTAGVDDPNDDETSDDPADDDDAWEGLSALGETEVPVPAWFEEMSCQYGDFEFPSDPLCVDLLPHTSFLTLQRLRC
jgi:hypothetical protein